MSNRTEEQEIIVDALARVENSIGVKAFAGTGKSYLLKEATLEYPKWNFLGLAFNSSIVAENSLKFPKKNTIWSTVHGLARTFFQNSNFDIGKIKDEYYNIDIIDILKIKNDDYVLSSLILEVFDLYCNSDLQDITVDGISKTAYHQNKLNVTFASTELLEIACGKAKELWNLFLNKRIKMTHSFYLKLFETKRLATTIKNFDYVLLDEAQDTNPVTMSILNQINSRKIYVGDPHQSIYAFRGVINAINHAEEHHYLSSTFRYQTHIANQASDLLFKYKNEKKRITSMASTSKEDKSKAIIFRNNSSMIEAIDECITNGIKYKTLKNPEELFKLAIVILEFKLTKKYPTDRNFAYFKKFRNYEELKQYIKDSQENELQTANKMQERYGKGLYRYLIDAKKKFKEPYDGHIFLCTGHLSKGLEWGEVDIFHDFPNIEKKMIKNDIVNATDLLFKADEGNIIANEIIQEINLRYVAITRAKHTLNFLEKK